MVDKPNPNDFMHKGVLMASAYDAAVKTWEASRNITIIPAPKNEVQVDQKQIGSPPLVPESANPVPEEPDIAADAATSISPTTNETLTFKIGNTISWRITPITKDGSAAQIQLKSLKVISEPPSVEVSATGENSFALIPFQVGSSQLIISFTSVYGKLVTKTYKINVVDGSDEAIDMKVEYTIQG